MCSSDLVEPDIEYFDEIDEDGVNKVLEYYNVDRLFVGHTKFEEPISFFDGKIICVNVDNAHNRKLHLSGAVKIKNGILYHQLYNNPNCKILDFTFRCIVCLCIQSAKLSK